MIDEGIIKKSFICSYSRKSEEDESKQIQSIPDQKKVERELAKRDNIVIPRKNERSEEMSGGVPGRPVFGDLIREIEKQDHAILFCWHFNRLSRNPIDSGNLQWLLQKGKLTIVTPNQIFDQNTNVIVTSVEGAQGNQFLIELSRNVKRGNQGKRDRGVPSGVAPPGYRNAGTQKGNKWFEPDNGEPNRFRLVQNALRLILNGTPPPDALRILNNEWGFRTIKRKKLGGGPIAESTWYVMLGNPLYYGEFRCFKGTPQENYYKIKDHRFKPMITEEEYWKIQDILGEKRGRQRPRLQGEERGAFLQLLTCGTCGKLMSHDPKRQIRCLCKYKYGARKMDTCPKCGLHESQVPEERKRTYDHWFCPTKGCPQSVIHTWEVEQQIVAALDSVTVPEEFVTWALEYLDEANDEEIASQEATLKSLQNTYELKQKELGRLNQAFVKGGYEYDGGEADYQEANRKLIAEKNTIKKRIDEYDVHADDWRNTAERGYLFCKQAKEAFTSGNYRTKREILTTLCEKAVVTGKKVVLTIEPPFVFIQKKLDEIKKKFPSTELEIISGMALDVANKSFADAVKTAWLPRSDSN